ncbi:5-carboxymethyl-2-hydroxymuconate semialdehyde dehydrogenase [Vibrio nigripulchritudo]|uniref:5-carboxymethyl-2-hydroxymuconate semialdehyde dehydrogenase n=1 Tax=Vibrio nigripulchritudo TaxID=28173 RepID=UPI00190D8915|nr:5-carboxymethyl-2-hydroxymuconate semialdehyde dehydrogenase [Vibrio nigripulchritudo]BCL73471.1 5-carboxymethyl-2-hydroxymuconate semialdehyde dehydrogenase [Vibrio nigripulchritudo]BDU34838.1 5-carboxymethyl-2-hydroxymuconate semialdehyde dehydrogenase [Vibrio nigripulchritudo]
MTTLDSQITKAREYLARFKTDTLGHFINGEWTLGSGEDTFENQSPINNKRLGTVVKGSAEDVNQACLAAQNAFEEWANFSGAKRRQILHKLADEIERRAEEIALVESVDCGQAFRFMKQAAVRGAANFRFFADKAPEAKNGDSLFQESHTNFTVRTPIGPVGVITPWNTPFMLSTWKIAPALAAGCTVVHKPAEFSPLSAAILAECAQAAGLPNGVWNMVNGFGEVAGKTLTEHPAIKAVAFVGETTTGSMIQAQGAPTLKRVHFELGGKNPVLVFDDADIERALDAVVFMIYSLNGQRCTSSSRLLLHSSIKDTFIAKLKERVGLLKVGHPLDVNTEVGPLIHPTHLDKVLSYLDSAKQEGASVLRGSISSDAPEDGYYFAPALIIDVDNKMKVACEEIFGPVLSVITFDNEEQAIQIANDTPYGLAAYIWTGDTGRSLRCAHKIEAGMVWVNSENNRNLPSPFGGMKMSGVGRDGGDWSFDFYMETKNICIAHDLHTVPKLGKES